MAEIAIAAAISVALAGAQYALTPKPKVGKVDRGRVDDLRFTTAEEGGFVPLLYGRRARVAGNIFWDTPTQEHVTTTPGRSGGKGGGGSRGAEPEATNYSYTKSLAVLIADALPGGANGRLRKIWEGTEVIYNAVGVDGVNGFREAEAQGNTLANGAVRAASTLCSGGQMVNLPLSSASVQFNSVDGPGSIDVTLYYISTGSRTLQYVVNNVVIGTLSLPSTSGAIGTKDFTVSMPALSNYLRFQGASGALSVDRVHLRATGEALPDDTIIAVGALDPAGTYPADLNHPLAFYNVGPDVDPSTGEQTGTLAAGGQSAFEFYTGVETQLQSPIMVAVDGADNVPAYRGSCYWVADTYQLKNGRLDNFTFEVDPGMSDLADIMVDLYKRTRKLTNADLDMTALAGLIVETLVIDSADGLAAAIESLQLWYNFDVVDRGSQIVAVLRGGASSVTITEAELSAYEEGQERPLGPVAVTYQPGIDAPGLVNVSFIDPSPGKDFHTSTVAAQRSVGTSVDPETLNFPIGGTEDEAVQVGLRYLYTRQLARKPFEFSMGPKYSHLLPTDVVTLALSNATHQVRLVQVQAALTGLTKARAVPEKASVYTQGRPLYYGQGAEPRPIDYPANTHLWIGDLPPLRLEDEGLVYYVAACKRGTGGWRGYRLYKEEITGIYEPVTSGDRQSMIGVVSGVLPSVSDPSRVDRTSSLVVDFYYDNETLASRAESEIMARPVNVLVVGAGQNMEVLQFANCTPSAAASPYARRYTFSTLLRGRNNTEYAVSTHVSGEPCLVLDDTVKARREDIAEVGQTRNFKAVTVGQALADATIETFLINGNSLRPPAVDNLRGIHHAYGSSPTADDGWYIYWNRVNRHPLGLRPEVGMANSEESEIYQLEIYDGSTLVRGPLRLRERPVVPIGWVRVYEEEHGYISWSGDGSLNTTSSASSHARSIAESIQRFTGDLFIEMTVQPSTGNPLIKMGLVKAGSNYSAGQAFNPLFSVEGTSSTQVIFDGVQTLTIAGGDRIAIRVRGTIVEYFKNYQGEASVPVYRSLRQYPSTSAMKLVAEKPDNNDFYGTDTVRTHQPVSSFFYSYPEAVSDFGFPVPDTITVRVYQESTLVGRGRYTETTIK